MNPVVPPGRKFTYSDVNYILLDEVVARVSGSPLDVFTRKQVFEPLSMNETALSPTWYRMQYLLTWNCKHLANANKLEHIQVLNARRRWVSPALVTPTQFLELEP